MIKFQWLVSLETHSTDIWVDMYGYILIYKSTLKVI